MPRYKLKGYNSGGYRSSREVDFNGKLEYIQIYDPKDSKIYIQYIEVTHPNGSKTHEDNEFLQKLLDDT